jgi:hypothetical protein
MQPTLEHFLRFPSSQAMSARTMPCHAMPCTRWHRTYGRKEQKKKKEKIEKCKENSKCRESPMPANPTNPPWMAIYLGSSTVQRTGAVLQFFRFHFHLHFLLPSPAGQCPFPRSTSLTSQASTPNSGRAPAYQ